MSADRDALVKRLMNMRDSLDRHAQHIHADICREAISALTARSDALRWRKLSDVPSETGRYVVAHCGAIGGHAYYTAKAGDTQYPVGWAQMPPFNPTHWIDAPGREPTNG